MGITGTFLWLVAEAAVKTAETAEEGGFGLDFNLFETNLVNLSIVIGILVYFGRGVLGKILGDRQSAIETAIREAEQRKQEAAAALADQQQKLAQAQAEATRIRAEAETSAKAAKAAILAQAELDIQRLREAAEQDVSTEQERVMTELRQRIATLALQKVRSELPSRLDDDLQRRLVDRSIAMLGGSN
ncbi:MAG: F0F1 ATP synthase subunit B [Scytolyngbya sp. HA4215-MV1]|jgi:F-type H+-transporting ATPase subunit b|nr:F0F1 ATP synthase subunit B [Scytolyngbya sp. HA4215-MV1]